MLLLLAPLARAQATFATSYGQATVAYKAREFGKAAELLDHALQSKQFATVPRLYLAAKAWAQAGNRGKALHYLALASRAGYDDIAQLRADSVFRPLYPDRRWRRVLADVTKADAALNQALKTELADVYHLDQDIRVKIREEIKRTGPESPAVDAMDAQMDKTDEQCLARVLALIDQHGWPSSQLVGREGMHTVFTVLQHARPSVQQKYLPRLRESAAKGELEQSSIALMEDRVLKDTGKPQVYGSQIRLNRETKKYEFFPIADGAHVEERRAAIGLEPLAEYAKRYGIDYKPKP